MNWISVEEELPELGDYSVIVHFTHGEIDIVHVEDYFKDITNGVVDGVQTYTKWYIDRVTHWMFLPGAPLKKMFY